MGDQSWEDHDRQRREREARHKREEEEERHRLGQDGHMLDAFRIYPEPAKGKDARHAAGEVQVAKETAQPDSFLMGTLLDEHGRPLAHVSVEFRVGDQAPIKLTTSGTGEFRARSKSGEGKLLVTLPGGAHVETTMFANPRPSMMALYLGHDAQGAPSFSPIRPKS